MGAGFNALAEAGVQNAERQSALKDDERQAQLQNIATSGLTPEAQRDAIHTLYAKDPSALKRHIENLAGRLVGRKPQPTPMAYAPQSTTVQAAPVTVGDVTLPAPRPFTVGTPGAKTQAERLQQDLAGGKTQQQQQVDAYRAETDIANKGRIDAAQQEAAQKQKQTFDLIDTYIKDPEENKAAKEDYVRKQAGIVPTLKNIPGAAGQPYQSPNGQWVRPVQQADGSIVEQPLPAGWKPPAPKLSTTPRIGTSNGKNVYGTLTANGWVDSGTGKPLTDFRPLPTYAQTGSFTPVEIINNGQPGVGSFNRKTGKTTASTDGATPLPTSVAKDLNANIQAAIEANTRLRTMQQNADDALKGNQQAMLSLVANHIGMTLGQQKGARINQAVWNEAVQSTPWLQGIQARFGPNGYLSGVTLTPQQIGQMLELGKQRQQDMWTQAEQSAQAAGFDLNMENLKTPGGRGAPAPKQGKQKVIVQHSASTNQYRYSMDGGRTWQPGQPPSQ